MWCCKIRTEIRFVWCSGKNTSDSIIFFGHDPLGGDGFEYGALP